MSGKHDPDRWLDTGDVDPDLLEALEATQSDFPTAAQLAAVEASIVGTIGGGGGGGGGGSSGGPTSIPPAAGATMSPAIPAALVALGLVGGAVAFLWPDDAPPAPTVQSPPVAVVEAPEDDAPPETAPSEPAVEAPNEPEPETEPAPAAPLDEGELLERARRRVRSSPAGALRLLRTHRRRFPAGVLSEERDALWVEALHRRGRVDEARASFDAFARAYPGSVHRVRLRSLFRE